MFKLVVLSVIVALAAGKPSALAPWGLGFAGPLAAPFLGAHLGAPYGAHFAAPLAAPIVSAPAVGAYNYRGPLSLGPGQPASILAADGRPLDTISVNLDRAAHITAKAVDAHGAHGLHLLKKRSAPLLAPAAAWAHGAPLAAHWAAPLAAPVAPLAAAPWAPAGPLGHAGLLGPAPVLGHAGALGHAGLLGHGFW